MITEKTMKRLMSFYDQLHAGHNQPYGRFICRIRDAQSQDEINSVVEQARKWFADCKAEFDQTAGKYLGYDVGACGCFLNILTGNENN